MVAPGIKQPTARCAIALAVALLVGGLSVFSAWAQVPSVCPGQGLGRGQDMDPGISLALAEELEQALNTDDPSAALALFADNAVAASNSSKRWHGKSELRDFLTQIRNPTDALDTGLIETRVRCATADRLVWLFDYPSTGGAGSADIFVHDGRITHVFWTFTPPSGMVKHPIAAEAISNPAPPWASAVSATFCACAALALVAGGLVRWRRRRRLRASTSPAQPGLLAALASGHRPGACAERDRRPVAERLLTEQRRHDVPFRRLKAERSSLQTRRITPHVGE